MTVEIGILGPYLSIVCPSAGLLTDYVSAQYGFLSEEYICYPYIQVATSYITLARICNIMGHTIYAYWLMHKLDSTSMYYLHAAIDIRGLGMDT